MNENNQIYAVGNPSSPFQFFKRPIFLILSAISILIISIIILSFLGIIPLFENSRLLGFISVNNGPHESNLNGYRISAQSKVPKYTLKFDEGRLFTHLANYEVFDSENKNLSTVERIEISLIPENITGGNTRVSDEGVYAIQSLQKYTTLFITIHINSNYIRDYGLSAASSTLTEQVILEAVGSVRNIQDQAELKLLENEIKASLVQYEQVQIEIIEK